MNAIFAGITASLSPSAEVNINALAVSLALQIVKATNNNVDAAFKFLDVAKTRQLGHQRHRTFGLDA